MKETTIKKYMDLFTYAVENSVSIRKACEDNNISYSTVLNLIGTLRNVPDLSEDEEDLLNIYNQITNRISVDTSENRSEVIPNRDDNGKIISYNIVVYKK